MKKIIFLLMLCVSVLMHIAPIADAYYIRGPESEIDAVDIKIDGKHYILLTDFCRAYGIEWEWDSISRRISLRKDGKEVVLLEGSRYYSAEEKIKKLSAPVRMKDGLLYIPRRFEYKAKRLFKIDKKSYTPASKTALPKPVAKVPKQDKVRRQSAKEFKIRKVVVDPGHGGKDPGAIGRSGLKEKDVVLDVAGRIKKELEKRGIEVIMTRDSDVFVSLAERGRIANANGADLFVSVHANANKRRWIGGFETYFLSDATDDNARSLAAAENSVLKYEDDSFAKHTKVLDAIVWDLEFDEHRKSSVQLAEFICNEIQRSLKPKRSCVKSARFYVLNKAEMLAVLIELSYLSNRTDERNLQANSYKQSLAGGIASGIIDFKREYDTANGFSR